MPSERASAEIDYQMSHGDFSAVMAHLERQNQARIDEQFSEDVAWLREGLDLSYRILSYYVWLLNAPQFASLNKASSVLFSALHKNLIALHGSLRLTRLGLYGPARAVLRQMMEALVIAKFSSVSHDVHVMERWKGGDVIYFSNAILKKISKPDAEPFRNFWGLMSEYSHATVFAQQVAMNVLNDPEQVPLTMVYMRILLDWQHHAMVSHFITPSMHYAAKRYANGVEVSALKARFTELLRDSRKKLLPWPREIIRAYRSTWVILPTER